MKKVPLGATRETGELKEKSRRSENSWGEKKWETEKKQEKHWNFDWWKEKLNLLECRRERSFFGCSHGATPNSTAGSLAWRLAGRPKNFARGGTEEKNRALSLADRSSPPFVAGHLTLGMPGQRPSRTFQTAIECSQFRESISRKNILSKFETAEN